MVVVISDDWPHNFDSLAKDLGIPSNTLRRYFKLFQQFIPNKLVKRGIHFNQDAKKLFEIINNMYARRMSTAEILQELAATRMPTLDVRPSPPAQAPDRQSPPALPDTLAALLPLAERYLAVYERQTTALEAIASALASNSPYKRTDQPGDTNPHPDQGKPQETPVMNVVDRQAVIARVMDLNREGLGQHAIMTRVRREGLRLSARGQLSKSTVARIIKGDVRS